MKLNFTILISVLFLNFSLAQNHFLEDSISFSFNLKHGVVGDFNGDGYDDILGSSIPQLDELVLLINQQTDPVSFSTQYLNSNIVPGFAPATGDFDNDGDLDFINTVYDNDLEIGVRHLFTNDGTGSFTTSQLNITNTIPQYSALSGEFMVDLDGDGDMDIVGEEAWQWFRIEFYVNEGNNDDFTYNIAYQADYQTASPEYIRPNTMDVRDIDQDGDMDILFVTYKYLNPANTMQEDEIKLLVNDGSNNFETLTISNSVPFLKDLEIVDINNDGLLDITAVSDPGTSPTPSPSQVVVWMQNPDLSFSQPEIILSDPIDYDYFSRMRFVDINNDNALDLVVSNSAGFIRYFINNNETEPDFNAEPIFVGDLQPPSVPVIDNSWDFLDYIVTGDFNNDGKIDLAGMDETFDPATLITYQAFRWYINDLDISPTSANNLSLNEDEWSLSPNPFHDFINLEGITVGEDKVSISSITGQPILKKILDSNVLDLGFVPEGVYVLSIISPDGKYSNPLKIIKLK